MTRRPAARPTSRRIRIRKVRAAGLLAVVAVMVAAVGYRLLASSDSTAASVEAVPSTVWPAHGQAAFVEGGRSQLHVGPNQHPAAIASVAKVMTAYLVLHDHPLASGQDGPTITLTETDVADTERRRGQDESVVSVVAGERLDRKSVV